MMQSQGCAGNARTVVKIMPAQRENAMTGAPLLRGFAFAAALGLIAAAAPGSAFAADANSEAANKDWPCKQILVEQISLPAVWSGPAIEGIDWRREGATADLVAELAARKTPIETAERAIEKFAASAGADKQAKLVAVFAGLFETLNNERSQIINGLTRFGRKQKALAAKIRAENAEIQKSPDSSSPVGPATEGNPQTELEWDLRVFDEGRLSLTYACEAPTSVEQRLFSLARAIQNNLD
jgi:hypothetical protein